MGTWQPFPLPDGSYSDDTKPWTQQDVVNFLPTAAEQPGTMSPTKFKTAPGLEFFNRVGEGPHRGSRDVEGKLFVVSGRKLYQVATDGTSTEIGTIPGTARVSMTHNQVDGGNQLIIATGDNSYVYDTTTEVLTATGVPLICVDFLNQLILGVDVGRRFWRYSGLADGAAWDELDNESAESSPDRIIGGIVSQGEWLVFGERTIEVFANSPVTSSSGTVLTAFQRSQVIEKGCANANTICRLDNTVYWVGNDGIPYKLNGYTPVPIASKAIIDAISSGNPRKLFAFTWEDKGHVVYYITAQDGQTFGYDVSTGKWHRRESFGLSRWRINTLTKWNGAWYAGDYQDGRMYRLKWGHVYEGCEIMPRGWTSAPVFNNGNRFRVNAFKAVVATGGSSSYDLSGFSITGSMPDASVGESVDFQYTVTEDYPGQAFITAEGLPTGTVISQTGRVTGAFTEGGEFTITITATDECGNEATHTDTVVISAVVLPPQLSDWRYAEFAADHATDYSAPEFDDSAWDTGTAPFGGWEDGYGASEIAAGAPDSLIGVGGPNDFDSRFASEFATVWTPNTRLWLRRTLTLSAIPANGLQVTAWMDDNYRFYVNGDLLVTGTSGLDGGGGTYAISSDSLVVGDNIIAIRCDDEAPNSAYSVVYADFIIEEAP